MMIAIGVICLLLILAWDGIVIFFINGGTIENLYEEDEEWHEEAMPVYPECKSNCSLRGSDYCIYKCWVEQVWNREDEQ